MVVISTFCVFTEWFSFSWTFLSSSRTDVNVGLVPSFWSVELSPSPPPPESPNCPPHLSFNRAKALLMRSSRVTLWILVHVYRYFRHYRNINYQIIIVNFLYQFLQAAITCMLAEGSIYT